MFRFIKKSLFAGLTILSSLIGATSLSCISMNNQAYKVRPEIISVNSNELVFYPFSIKTSKCSVVLIILMIHMQKYVFLML